jgi:hypothetical protein
MPDTNEDGSGDSANPSDQQSLFRSMAENFTSVYLTMLSIIQGVALTDLSQITFSEHAHFTAVNWVEVATMLWSLIYIWNHFMSDALMTHWIPDLEDAALLFGTGVFELVANHAIVSSPTAWLATLAIMFFAWSGGTLYIRRQEELVVREPVLMQLLRGRSRPLFLQTLGGGTLLGALAIVCRITGAGAGAHGNGPIALLVVTIAFAASLAIGLISAAFWRRVRRYAHTGNPG